MSTPVSGDSRPTHIYTVYVLLSNRFVIEASHGPIADSLKKTRGNAAAASRQLETTERILNYRIKQLGIEPRHSTHLLCATPLGSYSAPYHTLSRSEVQFSGTQYQRLTTGPKGDVEPYRVILSGPESN